MAQEAHAAKVGLPGRACREARPLASLGASGSESSPSRRSLKPSAGRGVPDRLQHHSTAQCVRTERRRNLWRRGRAHRLGRFARKIKSGNQRRRKSPSHWIELGAHVSLISGFRNLVHSGDARFRGWRPQDHDDLQVTGRVNHGWQKDAAAGDVEDRETQAGKSG